MEFQGWDLKLCSRRTNLSVVDLNSPGNLTLEDPPTFYIYTQLGRASGSRRKGRPAFAVSTSSLRQKSWKFLILIINSRPINENLSLRTLTAKKIHTKTQHTYNPETKWSHKFTKVNTPQPQKENRLRQQNKVCAVGGGTSMPMHLDACTACRGGGPRDMQSPLQRMGALEFNPRHP